MAKTDPRHGRSPSWHRIPGSWVKMEVPTGPAVNSHPSLKLQQFEVYAILGKSSGEMKVANDSDSRSITQI